MVKQGQAGSKRGSQDVLVQAAVSYVFIQMALRVCGEADDISQSTWKHMRKT